MNKKEELNFSKAWVSLIKDNKDISALEFSAFLAGWKAAKKYIKSQNVLLPKDVEHL